MNFKQKTTPLLFLLLCSIAGFLVRLPRVFHRFDKELHTAFYFFAFVFLSFLYPRKKLLIAVVLFLFGISIEYLQEYSNTISIRIIGKPIHGKFDIQDIQFNLMGLLMGIVFNFFMIFLDRVKKK